jgi:hypothetical protein
MFLRENGSVGEDGWQESGRAETAGTPARQGGPEARSAASLRSGETIGQLIQEAQKMWKEILHAGQPVNAYGSASGVTPELDELLD